MARKDCSRMEISRVLTGSECTRWMKRSFWLSEGLLSGSASQALMYRNPIQAPTTQKTIVKYNSGSRLAVAAPR